eukprot:Blabericola_migrator_1__12076@NODE_743_length_6671_cov_113_057692_g533_i0_p7_GENE_NODE_743_length_6671_cov_113_057692_g533_i0NODE_743_length_6671_cov_113_057692_g533_i0_p7_ORF_typecomplete_len172_score46_47eIF3_N/PF09440_10/0_0072NAPRTase_N/PF17767_1/4_4e03NAPRTase_N/PF17767_1/0_22_NODE_743_length_6671_cov_113_057692_g533_i071586
MRRKARKTSAKDEEASKVVNPLSRGQRKRKEAKDRYVKKADMVKYLATVAKQIEKEKEIRQIGTLAQMDTLKAEVDRISAKLETEAANAKLLKLKTDLYKVTMSSAAIAKDEVRGLERVNEILDDPNFQRDPFGFCLDIVKRHAQDVKIKKKELALLKDSMSTISNRSLKA